MKNLQNQRTENGVAVLNVGGNDMTSLKIKKGDTNLQTGKQQDIIEMFQYIYESNPAKTTYYSIMPELSGDWRAYFHEKLADKLDKDEIDELIDNFNTYLCESPDYDLKEIFSDYDEEVINVLKTKKDNEYSKINHKINAINNLCKCINSTKVFGEDRNLLSVSFEYSEERFDKNFGDPKKAPLLYVFLKSLFIRKMSLEEIIEDIVVLRKKDICKNPEKLYKKKRLAACKILRDILAVNHLTSVNREYGDCYIGNFDFLEL